MRITRRLIAILLVIILVIFVVVEIYVHSYVPSLPVISKEEAFDFVYFYSNGSYEFSYSIHGCTVRWLAVWSIKKPTPSVNRVYVYLFKIRQNSSSLVQTLDIVPVAVRESCNDSGFFIAWWDEKAFYEDNFTVVTISYEFGKIGTYEVDFGLVVKIYQKTILGYLPSQEVKIPIQESLYYGP